MATDVKVWVRDTKDYFNDLKLEMRRVTWPNRKQVEGTTAVVIISVFAFAAYFAVVDSILDKGLKAVLHFFTK
jgi:preprotein translocase subunit SecE